VSARRAGAGELQLVASVVPASPERPPDGAVLRSDLAAWLPDHMLPAYFEVLEALPRTPSGKVDRAALARAGLPSPDEDRVPTAPRNAYEELLVEIWREVLHLDRVGVEDHFFAIGGHSLLATQVLARVRERLEIDLPLLAIFESPVLEELALAVEEAVLDKLEALEAAERPEPGERETA